MHGYAGRQVGVEKQWMPEEAMSACLITFEV